MTTLLRVLVPPPAAPPLPFVVVLICHLLLITGLQSSTPTETVSIVTGTSARAPTHWSPPIPGATHRDVVKHFIPPEMPWSSAHRGLDIQTSTGQVQAPAAGEIVFVGTVVDRTVVTIKHADGLLSSFEPIEPQVAVGDRVAAEQIIGTVSNEVSHCDIQCIHWGVRKTDAWKIGNTVRDLYIDPGFLLGWTQPAILWPIHSDP